MAAQVFLADFYSSQRPSQIGPTADFDCAPIPLELQLSFMNFSIFEKDPSMAHELFSKIIYPLLSSWTLFRTQFNPSMAHDWKIVHVPWRS